MARVASPSSSSHYSYHRQTQQGEEYPRHYHLIPPAKIKEMLYQWADKYPDLVQLENAQDKYGLPAAGKSSDCPHDNDMDGCRNYILTIQDFQKHPENSDSSNRLAEVFLSGELHGNERVGPTAVMEAAQLLLLAADCEGKPRTDQDVQAAKDCRATLEQTHGMTSVHRKWLARIVSTRRIVIVPTANALGYAQNIRTEGQDDPNRDFPYDVTNPRDCMKTIAGRTLNEIFREHMFQLSLTFHGGMEVVAYEWGAPTYYGPLSPDDTAQAVIAGAYSQYGGAFSTSRQYKYGTMNDMVYYVRGGFEDWAYAGSWDPDRVLPCEPQTHGGYDKEKTKYNNSTLRVFNMLVECSNSKQPADNTLGTSLNVFDADTIGNGHVSRNIRLSLLATDAVEPYVHMVGVNEITLTNDIVPFAIEEGRSCQNTQAVMVPSNQEDVTIRWTVGGAFQIDSTQLWYAKWESVPAEVLNCKDMIRPEDLVKYFKEADITSDNHGTGFFSQDGPAPIAATSETKEALGPVFSAILDVSKDFEPHDKIVVIAGARVDQSWKDQPSNIKPKVPPQSHVVNVRTNPDWYHESAGKIVQGRLDWYSPPLTVVVGDYKDSMGSQGGQPVVTMELSNRFGETTGTPSSSASPPAPPSSSEAGKEPSTPSETEPSEPLPSTPSSPEGGGSEEAAIPLASTDESSGTSTGQVVGIVALLAVALFVLRRFFRYKKKPLPAYSSEDDAEFGGYSDEPEMELRDVDAK